jgi:hypothetical protein
MVDDQDQLKLLEFGWGKNMNLCRLLKKG